MSQAIKTSVDNLALTLVGGVRNFFEGYGLYR